jgi:ATP-dependent Lhr-like helicase
LWVEGYVEHIEPPASPMHLFAQQILALCLQERGLPRDEWPAWIGHHPGFAAMSPKERNEILDFMLERRFLFEDGGVWSLGGQAEEEFGRRYFLDLMSAFTADALFTVKHGETELGSVHHLTFALRRDAPAVLLLSGRPWVVQSIDWPARVAYVVPTKEPGKSRWLGDGVPQGFPLCQTIARVLAAETALPEGALTKRAEKALTDARLEYQWLDPLKTTVRNNADGTLEWWTFAGAKANACLAATLRSGGVEVRRFDNFSVTFGDGSLAAVSAGIERVRSGEWPAQLPPITDEALDGLKFSACLPGPLARSVLQRRAMDPVAVEWVRRTPHVVVSVQPTGSSN